MCKIWKSLRPQIKQRSWTHTQSRLTAACRSIWNYDFLRNCFEQNIETVRQFWIHYNWNKRFDTWKWWMSAKIPQNLFTFGTQQAMTARSLPVVSHEVTSFPYLWCKVEWRGLLVSTPRLQYTCTGWGLLHSSCTRPHTAPCRLCLYPPWRSGLVRGPG